MQEAKVSTGGGIAGAITTVVLVLILIGLLVIGYLLWKGGSLCGGKTVYIPEGSTEKILEGSSGNTVIAVDCCGCYGDGKTTGYCDCDLTYRPVCGENGISYLNPGAATRAGTSVAYYGPCEEEQETCTDTDGGRNYYEYGTTYTLTQKEGDVCEKTVLTEYYCDGTEIKNETFQCEYGCENGVCTRQGCTETDDGDDPYHYGVVYLGDQKYEDYCTETTGYTAAQIPSKLVEYYCDGNSVRNKTYTCEGQCSQGQCVQQTCTETDKGREYETKGQTTGYLDGVYGLYIDYCTETTYTAAQIPSKLVEYYCDGNVVKKETVSCQQGYQCYDGRCTTQGCTETDDGDDIANKGTTTGYLDGKYGSYTDYCTQDQYGYSMLVEYYCDGNVVKSRTEQQNCAMCEDGECVTVDRYSCSDSDKGKNTNTKGTITYTIYYTNGEQKSSQYTDYCYDTRSVLEYFCIDSGFSSEVMQCAYGCRDGVCLIG
ncbi:MAG: hypothetical protein ACPL06_03400 [Candidatus Anstonellales archaeon]